MTVMTHVTPAIASKLIGTCASGTEKSFRQRKWGKKVKKEFRSRGYRGSPSNYEYTAKAYWKDNDTENQCG